MDEGIDAGMLTRITTDWESCTACRLCEKRAHVVALEDCRPDPRRPVVLVVGEAPGAMEDATGRPFHPDALEGALLRRIFVEAGVVDNTVITNVLTCRPPGDRDPQADEIASCRPRLTAIVAAADPIVIVSVGTLARDQIALAFPHARRKNLLKGVPTVHVTHPAAWLHGHSSDEAVSTKVRAAAKSIRRLVSRFVLDAPGVEGRCGHRWEHNGWWMRGDEQVRPLEACVACGEIR